jgi:DNA-binding CsgD family transcriptional regulator
MVLSKLPSSARSPRFAILISNPGSSPRASAPLLQALFQFTPVESTIAVLMMASLSTAAIAAELTITKNTLRDHLKSMFAKTGTRNQSQLLHTLLRCPAILSFPAAG